MKQGDLTPPRQILAPEQVDQVADAVIALARELWTVIDRQMVTERVLAARGIDLAAEIDAFVPDAAMEAALLARRQRLIDGLLVALKAK